MYRKIMVPIDLAHVDRLAKAIDTATDLARHYQIPVCFVGVTAETATSVAHTPDEFARKLEEFGSRQSAARGLQIETAAYPSHDPTVDLDKILIRAADENGADLIVMASHVPGIAEHFFSSHAGDVASHARISVFVVR
ncbi:universal stress protein [Microbaculum marinum]|uniref:Universal stress protein n=1 Tax=Microbaculum marinum TaxID=1764581 RepID=A0AAW9RSN9_9HYPH